MNIKIASHSFCNKIQFRCIYLLFLARQLIFMTITNSIIQDRLTSQKANIDLALQAKIRKVKDEQHSVLKWLKSVEKRSINFNDSETYKNITINIFSHYDV